MPRDPDEGLLHEVFGAIPIARLASNEMHQPITIPVVQLRKGTRMPFQMRCDQFGVLHLRKRHATNRYCHGSPYRKGDRGAANLPAPVVASIFILETCDQWS